MAQKNHNKPANAAEPAGNPASEPTTETPAADNAEYVAELEAENERLSRLLHEGGRAEGTSAEAALQVANLERQIQDAAAKALEQSDRYAELANKHTAAIERIRELEAVHAGETDEHRAARLKDEAGVLRRMGENAKRVVLKFDAALGHGTRKAGAELGIVVIAKDRELGELLTALRNPDLVDFQ